MTSAASPRVSIIIPAYNTAGYIGETLESVLAQTYSDYEIIVINDGSPDTPAMERVLAPFQERIVYLKQENRGLSGARNTGILAARGEYVALLDSDDAWLPNYLAVQTAILERDPTIDVLYPDGIIFGDSPEAGRRAMELSPSHGQVTFESLVRQDCNVRVFATARKDAIVRAGLFDESLRSSEDFDLWLRVVKQGGRISYHREPLVRYRRHAKSLSADPVWMCEHILRVLDKARTSLPLTHGELLAVEEVRRNYCALLEFVRGKKAFFSGDYESAIASLTQSNAHFNSRKVKAVIMLLRVAPTALRWSYDLRDQLLYRSSTRY